MDVDKEMPEFHALGAYYARQGGMLWVADGEDGPAGMIAVRPIGGNVWEICRLYVDPRRHGGGLAHRLLDQAENQVRAAGAARLVLWSDTRFDRAHRFYGKRSYVRHGPIRVLRDISGSLEFGYAKPVEGAEVLDIAAAASAEAPLADILQACVAADDATGFLPPLTRDRAGAYLRGVASDVGNNRTLLVAAWQGAAMAGFGLLRLDTPEDQAHRAEVDRLLVHPAARRRGLARAILHLLEEQAMAKGRSLLTLRTRAGGAGEATCHALGWRKTGEIPPFYRNGRGIGQSAALFWKQLGPNSAAVAHGATTGSPGQAIG